MDEQAFHQSRQQINPLPCVFEKAVLAGCAQCELSRKKSLAERELITCQSQVAHINCTTLLDMCRERATFALKLPASAYAPLPHMKLMQLQCGGLHGLKAVFSASDINVHALIQRTLQDNGSMLDLPWQDIVKQIAAWQSRKRASAKKPS